MKKIANIVLRVCILVVVVLVVGCSEDRGGDKMSDSEVIFETTLPEDWNPINSTRAEIVSGTTLPRKGFGVFAYYTENDSWATTNATTPNFMNNTKVTSSDNGTTWKYSPVKYWPHNQADKVSFFAYAPHVSSFAVNGTKLPYTVSDDVKNQVDLMWSKTNSKDLNKNSEKINFAFQHALAKIGFTAEVQIFGSSPIDDFEKVEMKITKIVLTSNSNPTGVGTPIFYKKGTLELDNQTTQPDWAIDNTLFQSYTLTEGNSNLENNVITVKKGHVATRQNIISDDSYLMILPQDFSSEGFDIYVEYEVSLYFRDSGSASSEYNKYDTYTNGCVGTVKVNFEAGKSYTFNIRLGLKNAVLGEISITNWEEKTTDLPQLVQ